MLGEPVPERARIARGRVGVVPQIDNLDPDFTVEENLIVYGRYFGMAEAAIRARIPDLLEFAGLSQRADTRIQTLSGGMKRRLTLARALVNDPELIFLDEPTTGLDPQARHLIWERLRHLLARGKTILLTTHFMDEAERLCDRLVIMDQGRIIAEGSAARADRPPHRAAGGRGARRRRSRTGQRARRPVSPQRCERSGDTALLLRARRRAAGDRARRRSPGCATCTAARTSRTCSSS